MRLLIAALAACLAMPAYNGVAMQRRPCRRFRLAPNIIERVGTFGA
jgi:hypothetical protein